MEDNPPFRLALWGYDRPSVDAFIAHLRHQVEEGAAAAPEPTERPLRTAGAEAAAMLARAAELAEEVGRRAEDQARALVADAEAQARQVVADAGAHAAQVVADVRRETDERRAAADRAVQDAETRWRSVARDLVHLRARLDEVLPIHDGSPHGLRYGPEPDLLAAWSGTSQTY